MKAELCCCCGSPSSVPQPVRKMPRVKIVLAFEEYERLLTISEKYEELSKKYQELKDKGNYSLFCFYPHSSFFRVTNCCKQTIMDLLIQGVNYYSLFQLHLTLTTHHLKESTATNKQQKNSYRSKRVLVI